MAKFAAIILLLFVVDGLSAEDCPCWSINKQYDKADVCGSDGKDYQSPCLAKCHKAKTAYYGKCQKGAAAKLKSCSSCTDDYDPVCGKDGIQYGNACFAKCAKVDIANWGRCPDNKKPCNCAVDSKAPANGVCGSDGITYANECYAKCAGSKVVSRGKCVQPVELKKQCDYSKCTLSPKPVCGTDRRDYGNGCIAVVCGNTTIAHQGSCLGVLVSEPDNYMRWRMMHACGNDGKVYKSTCEAQCRGVGVQKQMFNENDPKDCVRKH